MTDKNRKRQGSVEKTTPAQPAQLEGFAPLLGTLRQLITDARQQVLRAVDAAQVQTYWHIGRHIVEYEQSGAQRAAYGQRVLPRLGQALSANSGGGSMRRICGTCAGSIWRFPFATHCVAN